MNGEELVGLPHEVTFGFVRIATNQRLGAAAVPLAAARATVEGLREELRERLPDAAADLPAATGAALKDAVLAKIQQVHERLAELSRLDTRFQELLWDHEHTREVLKFLNRKREDASIAEPSRRLAAIGGHRRRKDRHGPWCILSTLVRSRRQSEGRDRHGAQDRGAVLQHPPIRESLRRPGR